MAEIIKINDGTYDDIFPMHGTFPKKQELIPKLIEGAQEIIDGKASGTDVMLYKFPYAGFLCDIGKKMI